MCAAGLLFPMMNGAAKTLGADYSTLQVSWARAFGHVVFMLAAFLPRHGIGLLRTRRPWLQIARSATLFTSNLCFFFAVVFIPIAKAGAISMTAPLIVAILAWPMLGERTTRTRVLALAIGFAGVLIVIRPGTAVFHVASLFVLASAASYGLYQILTRLIAAADPPETSTVYSSVVGAFVIVVALPFVWETPKSLFDLALFCSLGVLGALGHYCVASRAQLRARERRLALPVLPAPRRGRRGLARLQRPAGRAHLGRRRRDRAVGPVPRLVADAARRRRQALRPAEPRNEYVVARATLPSR